MIKNKLKRDKVISMTKHGDLVRLYVIDEKGKETMLAELDPKRAEKIIKLYNEQTD